MGRLVARWRAGASGGFELGRSELGAVRSFYRRATRDETVNRGHTRRATTALNEPLICLGAMGGRLPSPNSGASVSWTPSKFAP